MNGEHNNPRLRPQTGENQACKNGFRCWLMWKCYISRFRIGFKTAVVYRSSLLLEGNRRANKWSV
ncbi:hypothetical protein I3760_11G099600 [Carya illinoinensis]|nr:hypothetical protein I3760_11G099600 [Carya illinoinensis]